jgi:hypothetical protein
MTEVATRCANCEAPIVDPTTQVIHGRQHFCCPNCSAAMEQQTGGTDPRAPEHENDLICSRCRSRIVDDQTMEMRGDDVFCCRNCMAAARAD